jgi:hypothetical protein
MPIHLSGVKNLEFFLGVKSDSFVNYFVKTDPGEYLKIVILAQH